jgi:hypothetical protein
MLGFVINSDMSTTAHSWRAADTIDVIGDLVPFCT